MRILHQELKPLYILCESAYAQVDGTAVATQRGVCHATHAGLDLSTGHEQEQKTWKSRCIEQQTWRAGASNSRLEEYLIIRFPKHKLRHESAAKSRPQPAYLMVFLPFLIAISHAAERTLHTQNVAVTRKPSFFCPRPTPSEMHLLIPTSNMFTADWRITRLRRETHSNWEYVL